MSKRERFSPLVHNVLPVVKDERISRSAVALPAAGQGELGAGDKHLSAVRRGLKENTEFRNSNT